MNEPSSRVRIAGADAARIGKRKGWAVAVLEEGRLSEVLFVLDLQPFAESSWLVAVDIPIGLPGDNGIPTDEQGRRLADAAAKKLVGKRRSSIFWTPPRTALDQPTYAEARQRLPSLSSQAYHLRAKILEVGALVEGGAPFIEFHPEVSFRALHGRPLDYPKKTWNGQEERLQILRGAGIELPEKLAGDAGLVPADDLLDATVGAVTAQEVAAGQGLAIGGAGDSKSRDRGVIWYPRWIDGL